MTKSLIERLENLTPIGLLSIACTGRSMLQCNIDKDKCEYLIKYTPNSSFPRYAYSDNKQYTFHICILQAKQIYGSGKK